MTRQNRLERNRLIRLTIETMEPWSLERELSDLYMQGESDAYIREQLGWTGKRLSATKRKIKEILLDAGIQSNNH